MRQYSVTSTFASCWSIVFLHVIYRWLNIDFIGVIYDIGKMFDLDTIKDIVMRELPEGLIVMLFRMK